VQEGCGATSWVTRENQLSARKKKTVRTTRLEWESMVTYQPAQPWWYVLIVVIRID
jgi:hypothetical protein